MLNKPVIFIAAISSRPYVKAATEAGFEVIAIDAFADDDTKRLAQTTHLLACEDHQFNAAQLLSLLDGLDLTHVIGFCYGAGFESTPEILAQVSQRVRLLGNMAETVRACKIPLLCWVYAIPYLCHFRLSRWIARKMHKAGSVRK